MAAHRQPPIPYIDRTRTLYSSLGHGEYRWATNPEPPAWVDVEKPLADCRVGLIATGGIYVKGQTAFTHADDTTYRAIPSTASADELSISHFAYDVTDANDDINVVFPIGTLRDLTTEGVIAGVADRFYGCMGGIYSQRRVREELAPALAERCVADEVDIVLLVPV